MWIAQLRGFFRKAQMDRELDEELASHLETHVADNVRAGMTPEQARRDALIKLGGEEKLHLQRIILALVGVYGVMSYPVSLQTREIGIRMGTGCRSWPTSPLSHCSRDLKLTLSGVMMGVISGADARYE